MDMPSLYIPTSQYLHQWYSICFFSFIPRHQTGLSSIPFTLCIGDRASIYISEILFQFFWYITFWNGMEWNFFVSDPSRSILVMLSFIQKFGSYSGYKINISKSECYPVNALGSTQ